MEDLAHEPPRVRAVQDLAHRAQRPGEAQPGGNDSGHLDRRRRNEPYFATDPEVLFGQGLGPRPDPRLNHLVVDLFAQGLDVAGSDAGGECQGGIADGMDVIHVFAAQHEHELFPGETGSLRQRECAALVKLAGDMEKACALHEGVVDVEECGLAVLRRCSRLTGHSDVFLLGHATSLVNDRPRTARRARDATAGRPRPQPHCAARRRGSGHRATVVAWPNPRLFPM